MPVNLSPRFIKEEETRIEIIPLIDIMFFLLASFMLVSLSMVRLQSVKVDLPTATTATLDNSRALVSISVDKSGVVYLEKSPVGLNELASKVASFFAANPETRVFISGDKDARHGDILHVLDIVRGAGIEKVAFEIRSSESK